MLADYWDVLAGIYSPEAFFGRVRRVSRSLDRSGHRLRQPLRHVVRDLRSFLRIATQLGFREAGTRRAFWGAMADGLLHDPRAFKITASLAALYLHLGPYSSRAVARLDREIATAKPARPVSRGTTAARA